MERIVGVDAVRPKLGKILEQAEAGDVFVVTSRSKPRGVIVGYEKYQELRKLADMGKRLQVKALLDKVRERGEEAGLSEDDVLAEIEAMYRCER